MDSGNYIQTLEQKGHVLSCDGLETRADSWHTRQVTSASPWSSGYALNPVSNVLASSLDVRPASILDPGCAIAVRSTPLQLPASGFAPLELLRCALVSSVLRVKERQSQSIPVLCAKGQSLGLRLRVRPGAGIFTPLLSDHTTDNEALRACAICTLNAFQTHSLSRTTCVCIATISVSGTSGNTSQDLNKQNESS